MPTQEEVIGFIDRKANEVSTVSLLGNTVALGLQLFNRPDICREIFNISNKLMMVGILITISGASLRLRYNVQEVMKNDMPLLPPEGAKEEVGLFRKLIFQNILMSFISSALSMRINQLLNE